MSALSAILVLGVLIFVHELGHFLVAKWYRIGVLEFALGFGPRIFRFTWGDTTYSLRCIPLGGFVRMVGDDPNNLGTAVESAIESVVSDDASAETVARASPIEGSLEQLTPRQKDLLLQKDRWFLTQPFRAKAAVVVAGPLFNILFAWLLASSFFYFRGIPDLITDRVVVGEVFPGLPAEKAGLHVHDTVVSVNSVALTSFQQLVEAVTHSEGKELKVVISRPETEGNPLDDPPPASAPSKVMTLTVKPSSDASDLDLLDGKPKGATPVYKIGVGAATLYKSTDLFGAIRGGALQVTAIASTTYRILYGLVTLNISPRKTIGGPIQMIQQVTKSAERGFSSVVQMMVFFNIMLAVMNLLPIPVLDGGHLLMFIIEKIKGSPISLRVQSVATQFGMGVLLLLMVFAVGNDLIKLFS